MEGKTHWGSLSTSPPTYTPKRDRTLFREARVIGPRGGRVRPTCREYEHGAELFGLLFGCGLGPPMVRSGYVAGPNKDDSKQCITRRASPKDLHSHRAMFGNTSYKVQQLPSTISKPESRR